MLIGKVLKFLKSNFIDQKRKVLIGMSHLATLKALKHQSPDVQCPELEGKDRHKAVISNTWSETNENSG